MSLDQASALADPQTRALQPRAPAACQTSDNRGLRTEYLPVFRDFAGQVYRLAVQVRADREEEKG